MRRLGFHGRRLSGFGDAGSPVIGNFSFQEQWSYDDWSRMPPSSLSLAKTKWQDLQDAKDMGSPTAASIMAPFQAPDGLLSIPYWITNVDQRTRITGAGGPGDADRIFALGKLNAAITALANVTVPDPEAEAEAAQAKVDVAAALKVSLAAKATAAAATKTATIAAAAAKVQGTTDAIAAAQAALAAAQTAKAQAQAAAAAHAQAAQIALQKSAQLESTIKTPLILAAVGIPLVVIAWMAMKRSKPVAGYRRRSRR